MLEHSTMGIQRFAYKTVSAPLVQTVHWVLPTYSKFYTHTVWLPVWWYVPTTFVVKAVLQM